MKISTDKSRRCFLKRTGKVWKLINSSPISTWQQWLILLFFMIYAKAKSLINLARGHRGRNSCEGWHEAENALARATLRAKADRKGSTMA